LNVHEFAARVKIGKTTPSNAQVKENAQVDVSSVAVHKETQISASLPWTPTHRSEYPQPRGNHNSYQPLHAHERRHRCALHVNEVVAQTRSRRGHLRSRGHLLTTLRTSAACVHAALHITDPFAIIGTLAANLGAFSANVLMVIATDEHEMSRRPANFGARHHQLEVRRLGMLAAHIQTVPHRHR
jgi:hypothetical protein